MRHSELFDGHARSGGNCKVFLKQFGCRGAFADLDATWLRIQLHGSRVGSLSKIVALWMGLTKRHASMIADAAVLHDIGKFFVPANYFQKTVSLSDCEWAVVRQHPVWGHAVLSSCRHPALRMAATVALQHHEKWDGSGYPNQLSGQQISLEARIVSICDVYDALRDDRPYHNGISHAEAVRIVELGDGRTEPRMFDPAVHQAFLECGPKLAVVFNDLIH